MSPFRNTSSVQTQKVQLNHTVDRCLLLTLRGSKTLWKLLWALLWPTARCQSWRGKSRCTSCCRFRKVTKVVKLELNNLGLSTALGLRPRAILKTSGIDSPNTDLPAMGLLVFRPRANFLPIQTDLGRWITFLVYSYWELKVSGKVS